MQYRLIQKCSTSVFSIKNWRRTENWFLGWLIIDCSFFTIRAPFSPFWRDTSISLRHLLKTVFCKSCRLSIANGLRFPDTSGRHYLSFHSFQNEGFDARPWSLVKKKEWEKDGWFVILKRSDEMIAYILLERQSQVLQKLIAIKFFSREKCLSAKVRIML